MMRWWHNFRAKLRRFRAAQAATAAVEFALILPAMLTLYLGSVEASMLITMDRRVQSVAGSLGDLVARADTTLTTTSLTDYFRASSGIMTPYPSTDVRQNVSLVQVRANGTTNIIWSRQYVNGTMSTSTTRIAGTAYANMPTAMTTVAAGSYVVAAEASYSYLPLYGLVIQRAIPIYRENLFMPRFGGVITLN